MTGACGQDRNVTFPDFEILAVVAAEADQRAPARDCQCLMHRRVIMEIIVDTIAPCLAPAVRIEQRFDHFFRAVINLDCALVEQKGQWAVRDQSVIRENKGDWRGPERRSRWV